MHERNLEDILIDQLENIESGLQLISRQLSTPAGRLDILCKDIQENYIVVELKKAKGSDLVVGQIMRYMGWVKKEYNTNKVRGIIIVNKKDLALEYAVSATDNIIVKEFKLSIE